MSFLAHAFLRIVAPTLLIQTAFDIYKSDTSPNVINKAQHLFYFSTRSRF